MLTKRSIFSVLLGVILGLVFSMALAYAQLTRSVTLQWDSNTEQDIAGYNLYRSEQAGTGYVKINGALIPHTGGGVESYEDLTAEVGKTYFYVATAVNTSDLESGYSNEVNAFVANPNAPAPPTAVIITGLGPVALLDWQGNEGATGYEVYFVRMLYNEDTGKYERRGSWQLAGVTTDTRFEHSYGNPRQYAIKTVYRQTSESLETPVYDPHRGGVQVERNSVTVR